MTVGRLTGLLAKVDDLPGKRTRASLVARLKVFEQRLGDAESALTMARASEALVAEAFPGELPGDEIAGVKASSTRAAKEAKRLRKKLEEEIDFIAGTKADEMLTRIVESATGARDAVTGEWKKRVSSRVSALRPIAIVAKDAGLSGAEGLVARLQTLEKSPVPTASALAQQVRSELASVATDVTTIGLDEGVSKFVEKAILGRASAKDLEKPDVRAFLDAHKLWDRLTVKLG